MKFSFTGHQNDIQRVEEKYLFVDDYITAVIHHRPPGLYLFGDGGMGKSYRVINFLENNGIKYLLHNSRMTAKGLFLALQKAPDEVHVLEDMERITNDRDAQGVLRSAIWTQPGKDRIITWTTQNGEEQVRFNGGIIMISNRPMADLKELHALRGRMNVYELSFSEAEIEAYLFKLASTGYWEDGSLLIEADDALTITKFLIDACRERGGRLQFRLQNKAFQLFILHEKDQTRLHWKDLLRAAVSQSACELKTCPDTRSVEDRKEERRQIVKAIDLEEVTFEEKIRAYHDQTGFSKSDYCRRKQEIDSGEFDL